MPKAPLLRTLNESFYFHAYLVLLFKTTRDHLSKKDDVDDGCV